MKKVVIAFDVDGTLISNTEKDLGGGPVPNERIRSLLISLAAFKNTKIIVWSGGGETYARLIAAQIGIRKYVDGYADKMHAGVIDGAHKFAPGIKPDIAIDDIQGCKLGLLNLIVREK